jgi:hypothetical protein
MAEDCKRLSLELPSVESGGCGGSGSGGGMC